MIRRRPQLKPLSQIGSNDGEAGLTEFQVHETQQSPVIADRGGLAAHEFREPALDVDPVRVSHGASAMDWL